MNHIAFFALIGVVCWLTKSGWPLMALMFMPSVCCKGGKN